MAAIHYSDFLYDQGMAAERVRNPNRARAVFARWHDGQLQYLDNLTTAQGEIVHPFPLDYPLVGELPIPIGAEEYGSEADLFEQVRHALALQNPLPNPDLTALAAAILAGWVAEGLDFLPVVAIVGPAGSGRMKTLRSLAELSRRPMILDRVRPALYRLLRLLRPTLLFDFYRPTLGRSELDFVAASTERRIRAITGAGAVPLLGPRFIACPLSPSDPVLAGRIIAVQAVEQVCDSQSSEERAAANTEKLVSRLALFRLRTFLQWRPAVPGEGLSLTAARVWSTLAPFVGKQRQMELEGFLKDPMRGALDPLPPPDREILSALFALAHSGAQKVQVQQLSKAVNLTLRAQGEPPITPKKAGCILDSYGIARKDEATGRMIELTREQERIHRIASVYGVVMGSNAGQPCPHCERFGFVLPAAARQPSAESADGTELPERKMG